MSITKLPAPLPKVHQCGCGSQAFHLCEDGRVVCLQCRYVIEPLSVVDSRVAEPASLGAEAAAREAAYELFFKNEAKAGEIENMLARNSSLDKVILEPVLHGASVILKHLQHQPIKAAGKE